MYGSWSEMIATTINGHDTKWKQTSIETTHTRSRELHW